MDRDGSEFYLVGNLGCSIPEKFNGRISLLTFFCPGESGRVGNVPASIRPVMSPEESPIIRHRNDPFNAAIGPPRGKPDTRTVDTAGKSFRLNW